MTDTRDPHDDAVDAAWRAQVRDVPPAALDDAIVAAAHRAVQSAPRAAGTPPRWRAFAPLAVAATLGAIAFGVLQLAPRDDAAERVVGDAPVAGLRKAVPPQPGASSPQGSNDAAGSLTQPSTPLPPPAPPTSRPQAGATPPAAQPVVPRTSPTPSPARPVVPSTAPSAAPPVATPDAPRAAAQRDAAPRREQEALDARAGAAADAVAQGMKDQRARPDAFPAAAPKAQGVEPPREAQSRADAPTANRALESAAPAPGRDAADALAPAPRNDVAGSPASAAAAGAPAARAKVASARAPEEFIRDLRRLRNEGHDAEAVRTLTAFRAAYADADARLPEDLRPWARGVR